MPNNQLTQHTAIICAAVRSTIILNLRRVQQHKPTKAVSDGVIDPKMQLYYETYPERIDPAVHLLSRLRFPETITEDQGQIVLAAMRDYFKFMIEFQAYCEARLTISRLDPRMDDAYTILHSTMRHGE